MCLSDFPSSYVRKKTSDMPIEPDEIKSYIFPVSDNVESNPNIIVLNNELGEMQKHS